MAHSWLFEIENHFLSTKPVTYNGQDYQPLISPDSFSGVKLIRAKSDINTITKNSVSFTLINAGHNTFFPENLEGKELIIRYVDSGTQLRAFRYVIKSADAAYQKIEISADDYLSILCDGQWPDTPLISDLFPNVNTQDSSACVPVTFGTAYIPLMPITYNQETYFVIGPQGKSYTITELTSPHEMDGKSVYSVDETTFTSFTANGYVLIQVNYNGGPISWNTGAKRLSPLVEFYNSETSGLTGLTDVIQYLLKAWGASDEDFGDTWTGVSSVLASRGITFNAGFYEYENRKTILSRLCAYGHLTIQFGEKIEVYLLEKAPQTTITKDHIIKSGIAETGTFKTGKVTQSKYDSGLIEMSQTGSPQDLTVTYTVPGKDSKESPENTTLKIVGITDTRTVQKIGTLYYQRRNYKKAQVSFTGIPALIDLRPDQVITISDPAYGGTYDVLIDSMTINKNSTIDVDCIVYSCDLDDWDDLNPDALNIEYDPQLGGLSVLGIAAEFTENWCDQGADITSDNPQPYDWVIGEKPPQDADKTTLTTIKNSLDGQALIITGLIRNEYSDLVIDFDAGTILVNKPEGLRVLQGADISLESNASDHGLIKFKADDGTDPAEVTIGHTYSTDYKTRFSIFPKSNATTQLCFFDDDLWENRFDFISIPTKSRIYLNARQTAASPSVGILMDSENTYCYLQSSAAANGSNSFIKSYCSEYLSDTWIYNQSDSSGKQADIRLKCQNFSDEIGSEIELSADSIILKASDYAGVVSRMASKDDGSLAFAYNPSDGKFHILFKMNGTVSTVYETVV